MFIVYIVGAALLSILFGPHTRNTQPPMQATFTPPGFERPETPTPVVEYQVRKNKGD